MKKSIIALTALLCLGVPTTAVAAADGTAELLQRIDRLTAQVIDRDQRLEQKSEILACERANRRELVRALRQDRAGVVKVCR